MLRSGCQCCTSSAHERRCGGCQERGIRQDHPRLPVVGPCTIAAERHGLHLLQISSVDDFQAEPWMGFKPEPRIECSSIDHLPRSTRKSRWSRARRAQLRTCAMIAAQAISMSCACPSISPGCPFGAASRAASARSADRAPPRWVAAASPAARPCQQVMHNHRLKPRNLSQPPVHGFRLLSGADCCH